MTARPFWSPLNENHWQLNYNSAILDPSEYIAQHCDGFCSAAAPPC